MEELIREYIKEASGLIEKQAKEILILKERARKANASDLAKKASEDILNKIAYMLGNEQYTQESIIKAIRENSTESLVKRSVELVDDSWGELEEDSVNLNNIRPSDRKLYSNLGLIN